MTRIATQNPPRKSRSWFLRITGPLLVIAALGFGWNYAWHKGAQVLDEKVSHLIRNSNDAGREIECTDRRIEGFPFRVGVFCNSVSLYAVRQGIRLNAGAFRSAAQFYAPGKLVGEMDGPLIASADSGDTYTADWSSLRASARVGLDGPHRISFEAKKLNLSTRAADATERFTAKVDGGELHLRPTPGEDHANAVDLAFLLDRLEFVSEAGFAYPAFALSADLRLDGMRDELRPGFNLLDHLRAKGISGEIRRAQFLPIKGGSVIVSGTFAVTPAGRLSATLDVSSTETDAIARFLVGAFPEQAEIWQQLEQAVALLASADKSGSGARKLTIEIDDGDVLVGPITVAEIPPLF
ncbi:MAG: DUF2125 domain-containing protein [Salaquimonas sp.]|nr:DUF2125 domain-containing protein [Salaquimonas sp.]